MDSSVGLCNRPVFSAGGIPVIWQAGYCAFLISTGNPKNDYSIKELASMMLEMSYKHPEYESQVRKVQIVDDSSDKYYGKGYQDLQNRVPCIGNTCEELGRPQIDMADALEKIMETYRTEVSAAQALLDQK